MTYYFVVAALFKNEEDALQEWIEHYKYHGAEHLYLIDDDSTDNSVQVIQPYIDEGYVTLFKANNWGRYLGRQKDLYNHFILPLVNQKVSKWTFICDLDEFLWTPDHIDVKNVLRICNHLSQIQINHTQFGSSNYVEQPPCIVKYFTYREEHESILYKYFVNSEFQFSSLNIHHASYVNKADSVDTFIMLKTHFKLNHYRVQSLQFWRAVKCTRGDSDHYLVRDDSHFYRDDTNDVIDLNLWEQNKHMEFYKDK